MALHDVIENILTLNGAVTEKQDDDRLNIILPPQVANILNTPEYTTLCFSYNQLHDDTVYATYDSEFFQSIRKLLDLTGRFAFAEFETKLPAIEKVSSMVEQKIGFDNATFRIEKTDIEEVFYLLFFVKFTALSDEKHEGLLPIMVNSTNASITTLHATDIIEELTEQQTPNNIPPDTMNRMFHIANRAVPKLIEAKIGDFTRSLERRLNRDIRRVYEYYEALKTQIKDIIAKKTGNSSMDEFTNRRSSTLILEEDVNKLRNKLVAIEAEQKWKVSDLVTKYTMSIKWDTVGSIAVRTRTIQCLINIKRRLGTRQFPVTYNPMLRQLDPLTCESCFVETANLVCDDHLHIVCRNCLKPCPHCGKEYCRKCYTVCPKCKKI
jgi:hypothetical protein